MLESIETILNLCFGRVLYSLLDSRYVTCILPEYRTCVLAGRTCSTNVACDRYPKYPRRIPARVIYHYLCVESYRGVISGPRTKETTPFRRDTRATGHCRPVFHFCRIIISFVGDSWRSARERPRPVSRDRRNKTDFSSRPAPPPPRRPPVPYPPLDHA